MCHSGQYNRSPFEFIPQYVIKYSIKSGEALQLELSCIACVGNIMHFHNVGCLPQPRGEELL